MHDLKLFFIRLVAAAFLIAFCMITSRTPETQIPAQVSTQADIAGSHAARSSAEPALSAGSELSSVQRLPTSSPRVE